MKEQTLAVAGGFELSATVVLARRLRLISALSKAGTIKLVRPFFWPVQISSAACPLDALDALRAGTSALSSHVQ